MLMSKSRLEKFLYALYSLDSSDLPTPLSRIEELYKCLVTGEEAPTFKPLSRVEKYLMCILGVYDVDSLPNPLSRVEVLLYKLVTGDDNLDGFDIFLSEHEELLAEIIRNGGVGGNIDIEYVLYTLSTEFNTLYNTAEKPVKSAILKGNTLVNLAPNDTFKGSAANRGQEFTLTQPIQPNKQYILLVNITKDDTVGGWHCRFTDGVNYPVFQASIKGVGLKKVVFTTSIALSKFFPYFELEDCEQGRYITMENVMLLEYQQGMENWDIPYFEGMQSVKMPVLTTTGKNLWRTDLFNSAHINDYYVSTEYTLKQLCPNLIVGESYIASMNYQYTGSISEMVGVAALSPLTNLNNSFIYTEELGESLVYLYGGNANGIMTNFQVEKGTIVTPFEEHKSNILTVNEDVELRGIGNVEDELNLLTGELTQRAEEVYLFDVNAGISNNYHIDNHTTFLFGSWTSKMDGDGSSILSNKLPYPHQSEGVWFDGWGLYLRIKNDRLTTINSNGLKEWMIKEDFKIIYPMKTESIKTVDLSVVNQDGNDTKLSTFNDITHVTLSSEGLIPEAELEVATKNEEDLDDSIVYTIRTLSEEFNTLYNTAKKPVKSAILKGQTLVNYFKPLDDVDTVGSVCGFQDGKIAFQFGDGSSIWGTSYTPGNLRLTNSLKVSPNTKYFAKLILSKPIDGEVQFGNFKESEYSTSDIITLKNNNTNIYQAIMTTGIDTDYIGVILYHSVAEIVYGELLVVPYQEGMENWDIPYFEGMKSVQMPVLTTTGKNLFDINNVIQQEGVVVKGNSILITENKDYPDNIIYTFENAPTESVLSFDLSSNDVREPGGALASIWYEDGTNIWITTSRKVYINTKKITDIKLHNWSKGTHIFSNIQLEKGTTTTSYEPYKSNILTVNEEVELRGIGEVKDEMNLLTGELTERIGEVVLDGSENWKTNKETETHASYYLIIESNMKPLFECMTNSLTTYKWGDAEELTEECFWSFTSSYGIIVSKAECPTVEDFKQKLSNNPILLQYELNESSIKTVDLSVVNQDGNNTKLSTFNDITHVTLSSEGLIPEAELEIAEKVPEVATSMLTISREQEVINTASNEQSENVDATMIATTEIYEELL